VKGGQRKALNLGLPWDCFLDLGPDGKRLVFMDEKFNNELWGMRNLFPGGEVASQIEPAWRLVSSLQAEHLETSVLPEMMVKGECSQDVVGIKHGE
jgi:hypothetical protein